MDHRRPCRAVNPLARVRRARFPLWGAQIRPGSKNALKTPGSPRQLGEPPPKLCPTAGSHPRRLAHCAYSTAEAERRRTELAGAHRPYIAPSSSTDAGQSVRAGTCLPHPNRAPPHGPHTATPSCEAGRAAPSGANRNSIRKTGEAEATEHSTLKWLFCIVTSELKCST